MTPTCASTGSHDDARSNPPSTATTPACSPGRTAAVPCAETTCCARINHPNPRTTGNDGVSVAVRKSSVVARSRSPLVASEKSPSLVRPVGQEFWPWAVTVAVPTSHRTAQGTPLKSARDRMDIISAYQQVGSYRAAAQLCGTTHRTVKRVVEKFEFGDAAPPRGWLVPRKAPPPTQTDPAAAGTRPRRVVTASAARDIPGCRCQSVSDDVGV